MNDVYKRLADLGIEIPKPEPLGGLYVPAKTIGNMVYISGQGATKGGVAQYTGQVGVERTLDEGREAAKLCILNMLSVLQNHIGDLNKVKNVVKILGFVASGPKFGQQPMVINAASQLLIDVFGENGRHARSAIGTNELPLNLTVEIEAIFEIE